MDCVLEGGPVMRILIVLLLLGGGIAYADDEILRGSVVRIEAKEIYVSLGSSHGVVGGAALRIKRPITLRHPITHAAISDWVPIGSASVTEAGYEMSRAIVGELVAEIKVGDIAEVLVDRPEPPRPVERGPVAPPVDAATAEVLGELTAQAGQSIDVRIASWERYLSIRPSSRYSAGIRRELDELRTLRDQMRMPGSVHGAERIATVTHSAPSVARAGAPLPLAFVLDRPDRVASAYLHYRPHGAPTYRAVLLIRDHGIYLHGAIPAEVVAAPGVDYFVEVAMPNGTSGLALGAPAWPIAVEVRPPTLLDQIGAMSAGSTVRFTADSSSFGSLDHRAGDRGDHIYTANLDFTYRLRDVIESVGVGAGVYAGTGGFRDGVWTATNAAPTTGFHYGYADMEVGGHADGIHVSVGGQLIAGVGKTGFGLGGEGRLRIGERDGTNVVFLGRTIDQVGFLSQIRFGARIATPLGLGISVGATDQPNEGDVGLVLGTELELYAIRNVSILARGSWEGRSVDHSGVGGGGGVAFNW
jgi:hypothetical protein